MSFSPDKIAAACQGRDARKGGLNVPELKQYVVAQGLVTNAGSLRRPQLIALICSAAAIPVPVAVKQKLPTKKAAAVKRYQKKNLREQMALERDRQPIGTGSKKEKEAA